MAARIPPRTLAPHHRTVLEQGSAITPDVIAERGYWTAQTWPDLEGLGFRGSQKHPDCFPALVIPHYGPDGSSTNAVLRYDRTPVGQDGIPRKYLQPHGVGLRLDVPKRCLVGLRDATQPLWWTEGAKKADALASVGLVAVNTPGVDGWRSPNAIPDLYGLLLKGRAVVCAYDSDLLEKPPVRLAVEALARWLGQKGAEVFVLDWRRASLPAGLKVGVDDFLAEHGSRADLEALVVPFAEWRAELSPESGRGRPSQATRLVALGEATTLWHTPDGQPYATVRVGDHGETLALQTRGFRDWLARGFYAAEGHAANAQAVQDALGALAGKALYEGPEQPVFVRVAEHANAIYLDLGDASWQAVEVTAAGWTLVVDPPVRFRRSKGLLSLPRPTRGGTLARLRPYVNVADEDDWRLLVAWLVQALRPSGPYPLLLLHGEQGTAKSTTARVLKALIDPSKLPLRAEPREARDLAIAAGNTWALGFDNLSHVPTWLSDALCRLATGGGFATRALYENDEEVLFEATRPVVLTGIEDLATRGDLLDRALPLVLPRIPDTDRRAERTFWSTFEQDRPALLGTLLDVVAGALKALPEVVLPARPRMADFAEWVTAAEPALGWSAGAFLAAYQGNRSTAHETTLEASPVGELIRQLAAEGDWEGTASDLLERLADRAGESATRRREWPRSGRKLSGELRRLAPTLAAVGVLVDLGERASDRSRRRLVRLRTAAAGPSTPSDVVALSSDLAAGASTSSTGAVARAVGADGVDGVDEQAVVDSMPPRQRVRVVL